MTWGALGELVDDVFPAKEESKRASGKKWHPIKAHLNGTTNLYNSQKSHERLTSMCSLTLTMATRATASR